MMIDDQQLIALTIANPNEGFRCLMTKYKAKVYWHIRRLVVSHADAQDATQETFVRIFRSLSQLQQDIALQSWIYRIATNEALRVIGKRHHRTLSLDDDDALSELSAMTADEYVDFSDVEAVKLQQAILTLPPKQQLTFNLRYYDEMSYEEIAAISGTSAASAKSNYHLAKEKITHYMQSND